MKVLESCCFNMGKSGKEAFFQSASVEDAFLQSESGNMHSYKVKVGKEAWIQSETMERSIDTK